MDYLRAQFDRVLMIVVGVLLFGTATYSIVARNKLPSEFSLPPVSGVGAPFERSLEVSRLAEEEGRLAQPADSAWTMPDDGGSLFVSRIYLLGDTGLVDLYDSDVQLFEEIPNSWLLKHGLDYTDKQLASRDPDKDGFSNIEEFRAGSDPTNPNSTPPAWTKLRVKAFEKIPFRIKFMGAPSLRPGEPFAEDTEFSINTLDYSSPTQFLRLGDKIAGTDLTIVKAESKTATNAVGSLVDVSELTLKDKVTDDEIVLITEKEVDSPYSYALLVNSISGQEIRVEKGKTFTMVADGPTYKLIDVATEGAVLTPVDSEGERLTVPPLQPTQPTAPQ